MPSPSFAFSARPRNLTHRQQDADRGNHHNVYLQSTDSHNRIGSHPGSGGLQSHGAGQSLAPHAHAYPLSARVSSEAGFPESDRLSGLGGFLPSNKSHPDHPINAVHPDSDASRHEQDTRGASREIDILTRTNRWTTCRGDAWRSANRRPPTMIALQRLDADGGGVGICNNFEGRPLGRPSVFVRRAPDD